MFKKITNYTFLIVVFAIQLTIGQKNNHKSSSNCIDSLAREWENMGLYGGFAVDLTYSPYNNRLFAGVDNPIGVYVSDDTGKTWYEAFNRDSLLFECETRGWGGRGERILANNLGWIGIQSSITNFDNSISTAIISFNGGDTNTWITAMDGYLLDQLGHPNYFVSGIGLSDYYFYSLHGPLIVRSNESNYGSTAEIMDITTLINGIDSTDEAVSIAIANSISGYPFYVIIDTIEDSKISGVLFKYDTAFSSVSFPGVFNEIRLIYTHPNQISGDTLFICGEDTVGSTRTFRSFDGGKNWQEISNPTAANNLELKDLDFSKDWTTFYPSGSGLILSLFGMAVSTDLGDTWQNFNTGLISGSTAFHPKNPDLVMRAYMKSVAYSVNGFLGTYLYPENVGFENIAVKQISSSIDRSIFYVATKQGLAYTNQYLNDTIENYIKWISPNGNFPISSIGDDEGFNSVEVNPFDSSNVIASYRSGFAVTISGFSGFQNINPSSFVSELPVNDIVFADSLTVLAVSGGDELMPIGGNIWRSIDKGITWNKVTPLGFSSGNCIDVGRIGDSIILYAGTGLADLDTGYLWKSTDMGLSWIKINFGPMAYSDTTILALPIVDLAVYPNSLDTLFICAAREDGTAFVSSFDGGINYYYITLPDEGLDQVSSVALNRNNPDSVYVAANRYVFVYDAKNDSILGYTKGFKGEEYLDLYSGSILIGSTTGFYSISIVPIDDILPTFINEEFPTNQFYVFPNPCSTNLNIRINASFKTAQLKIRNMLGQNLYISDLINSEDPIYQFNLSEWKQGLYFITIVLEGKEYTGKIMKID